jgi:acetyltransferase
MGDSQIQEAVKKLREFKIPEFRFPENAANSLGSLHKYSKVVQRQNANEIVRKDINQDKVKKILSRSDISKDDFMSEELAHKILEAYKIPVLKMELAENPNDARLIAEKIGFPVALKISSTDIQHKSDIGGVLLNLKSKEDVDIGFKKLVSNAQEKFPKASIAGVHIQKMATSGQEVIIGAIQDPQFGPLVMFGSGGTEVEGLEDIKFSLAPLTQEDIDYMLLETWAGKKLDGYRNIQPADRTSLEDALIRLAQLVSDFPEISEIEINPLNVLEGSNGVIAVDVRIKMSG